MSKLRTAIGLTTLIGCLGVAAAGQDENKGKPQREGVPKLERRAALSTLVDVFLRNDERMRGVVKRGAYVEIPDGVRFKAAKRGDPHAGIRLWHVAGATSFAFIPYRTVRSYRIVRTLSELEVREIASKARQEARAKEQKRRAEARRQFTEERSEAEERELLGKLKKLAGEEEKAEAERVRELEFVALLAKFPPSEGWLPTRLVEIRRRIAIDLFPTLEEKAFIRAFEGWKPAYLWWSKFGKARYETLEKARVALMVVGATEEPPGDEPKSGRKGTPPKPGQVKGTGSPDPPAKGNGVTVGTGAVNKR